jgi:hypothetical protein
MMQDAVLDIVAQYQVLKRKHPSTGRKTDETFEVCTAMCSASQVQRMGKGGTMLDTST